LHPSGAENFMLYARNDLLRLDPIYLFWSALGARAERANSVRTCSRVNVDGKLPASFASGCFVDLILLVSGDVVTAFGGASSRLSNELAFHRAYGPSSAAKLGH
jgi:hypothetical protein